MARWLWVDYFFLAVGDIFSGVHRIAVCWYRTLEQLVGLLRFAELTVVRLPDRNR